MRLLLTACLVLLPAWAAAQSPIAKEDDSTVYEAKPSPDGHEATLLLAPGVSGPFTVALLDGRIDPAAVSVRTLDGASGAPLAAIVSIRQKTAPAGRYTLQFAAHLQGKPSVAPIVVIIPAVSLYGFPPKISIEQTTFFWKTKEFCWPTCDRTIRLTPVAPDAWLTGLRALPAEAVLKDGVVTTGTLETRLDPDDTSTGGTLTLRAGTGFPLGTSSAKVRVAADQLAQPAEVEVTVVNRLSSLLLMLPLGVGLALGIFIRSRMAERIARQRLLIEAKHLDDSIRAVLETHDDATLRGELETLLGQIAAGLSLDSDALTTKVGEWKEAFKNSFESFGSRKALFLEKARALYAVVNRDYELPEHLLAPVDSARQTLKSLLPEPGNDVDGAEGTLGEAQTTLTRDLRAAQPEETARWRVRMDTLEALAPLLPAAAPLEKARQDLDQHWTTIAAFMNASAPTLDEMQKMLEAAHRGHRNWTFIAGQLPTRLEGAVRTLDREVSAKGYDRAEAWIAWTQNADTAVTLLRQGEWSQTAAQLQILRQALDDFVRDRMQGLSQDEERAVLAHLDAHEYVPAIRALQKSDHRAGGAQVAQPQPEDVAREVATGLAGAAEGSREGLAPAAAGRVELPPIDELERQRVALEWQQRVVIAVLVVVAGWAVLGPSFTGALSDFLTAFGWAFLTDISAEGLVAAMTPLKAKGG